MTGTIEATAYVVYPTGYDPTAESQRLNVREWTLTLERKAPGQWAVCRAGRCMNRRGGWAWESLPSSRTDRFKRAYRFDLDEAQALALKHIDTLTCMGVTWQHVVEEMSTT